MYTLLERLGIHLPGWMLAVILGIGLLAVAYGVSAGGEESSTESPPSGDYLQCMAMNIENWADHYGYPHRMALEFMSDAEYIGISSVCQRFAER